MATKAKSSKPTKSKSSAPEVVPVVPVVPLPVLAGSAALKASLEQQREYIRKTAKKAGLGEHIENVVAAARPLIYFDFDEGGAPVGASRMGGLPDAPAGFAWPVSKQKVPLPFIVQLNCADLAPLDAGALYPKEGLLSFFCSRRGDECAVFYFPPGTPLSQPRADGKIYPQAELVRFEPGLSLPLPNLDGNLQALVALPWTDKSRDELVIKLEQVAVTKKERPEVYPFQVGGYARWVNDGSTLPDEQLLLQFPSPVPWVCWSDSGHEEGAAALYFFVKTEDLKALRFDRVSSQLQAY